MIRRIDIPLTFVAALLVTLALLARAQGDAGLPDAGIDAAVVDAIDGGGPYRTPPPPAADEPSVLSEAIDAGRRSGFLWIGVGLGILVILQFVRAHTQPAKIPGIPPKPGSWRAKLSVVLGGAIMVLTALIDMTAESRGLTPVTTAILGALALYRQSADDPPPGGALRPTEKHGEVDVPPVVPT